MTAEEVAQKIAALDAEIKDLGAAADDFERQAREARARRTAARQSREALTATLNSLRVKQIILNDQQAAAQARATAEQHEQDLAKLKEEAATELAKLKAANEAAAKVSEPSAKA